MFPIIINLIHVRAIQSHIDYFVFHFRHLHFQRYITSQTYFLRVHIGKFAQVQ